MQNTPVLGRRALLATGVLAAVFLLPTHVGAEPASITYHYRHFIVTLYPTPDWKTLEDRWTYEGQPIEPAEGEFRGSGAVVPAGVQRSTIVTWSRAAIAADVEKYIAPALNREARTVTIDEVDGKVTFDGVGLPGRSVNVDAVVSLTIAALERNVASITIPLTDIQPNITVRSESLKKQGIAEVVTVGESDYSNSPSNRRHNIAVGVARFNGLLIPKDETFSFNKHLGPVNAATGFRKELVILGDKTVPDYGGGLCQVSTTAYRGVWEYGFPIVQRQNHSFAVSHYFPQGTDATIYPPNVDMKFKNDSPGSLLIQTHLENDRVYFIYYGTRDDRRSDVFGPYIWDRRSAPPERREFTADLPPGEMKKVGESVAGLKAQWFRLLGTGEEEKVEKVFSAYQARPRYFLIGAPNAPAPAESLESQIDPLQ